MRQLESSPAGDTAASVLDEWYQTVRDVPLCELSIGDVARACRQSLYLEYLIPVAITHLEKDPCAGDQYDGELLVSLRSAPCEFWARRPDLKDQLFNILSTSDLSDLDHASQADVQFIKKRAQLP